MTQTLICTRKKCSKRDLSNGPDHQQNLRITFLGKFCKDVALSQSYSAKGRRQLVHQLQVRNGLLSVLAWTRVGYGRLAESSEGSPIPCHNISLLTRHRGWSRNYHKKWRLISWLLKRQSKCTEVIMSLCQVIMCRFFTADNGAKLGTCFPCLLKLPPWIILYIGSDIQILYQHSRRWDGSFCSEPEIPRLSF